MVLRVARHTNQLERLTEFYCKILNLDKLGSFENHDNYDGVFIGKSNLNWHLEFTKSATKANQSFDEDDILVFYPSDQIEFNKLIENIDKYNVLKEEPINPYWKKNGIMISDPDGYKIIISNLKIK